MARTSVQPSGAVPVVLARISQRLARVAAWFWPGSAAQLVAPPNNAGWRADIDGLRALAVVGVVVYHVFPAALPGGFGGVDAFFVISGFLISGHLVAHFGAGRFSVASFFARRVRRLAPALLVVLAATLLAGWFTLLPTELAAVGLDTAAGAASVANLLMWHAQGYFDRAAVLKPLLHLWSLGVEEQFYLVWPLVLALGFAARVRAGVLVGATGAACFVYSLACSAWWPGPGFILPLAEAGSSCWARALRCMVWRSVGRSVQRVVRFRRRVHLLAWAACWRGVALYYAQAGRGMARVFWGWPVCWPGLWCCGRVWVFRHLLRCCLRGARHCLFGRVLARG
ncbi:acyltransferase family protein [Acetobacter pasteurianus]|uniref:acyltransferase family protein n=1 Tax=Acetobacter pasteurianus TaxID=438 RepID=UPI00130D7E22|nr:acyltransferase [Acetobacter pasteurianus]